MRKSWVAKLAMRSCPTFSRKRMKAGLPTVPCRVSRTSWAAVPVKSGTGLLCMMARSNMRFMPWPARSMRPHLLKASARRRLRGCCWSRTLSVVTPGGQPPGLMISRRRENCRTKTEPAAW